MYWPCRDYIGQKRNGSLGARLGKKLPFRLRQLFAVFIPAAVRSRTSSRLNSGKAAYRVKISR